MSFEILGLATAVPAHSIEQTRAMEFAKQFSTQTDEQHRLLSVLYRRTGVSRRHSVLLESPADSAQTEKQKTPTRNRHANSEAVAASLLEPVTSALDDAVSQSFYPPAADEDDGGPTTAERMACYATHASELAMRAAVEAIHEANIKPSEITHLVSVSCTGFQAPGFDLELIRELGLPAATARTHIGFMGCHGALNGLRVARAFAESDPRACVLVVAVELCSLHQQYGWLPDRVVANALFADGAAAIVGRACDLRELESSLSNFSRKNWRVRANGSLVLPDSEDVMSWRIGNHGFEMTLSPSVPDRIRQSLKPWIAEWLQSQGLHLSDVDSWALHPGGPRILSACGEALELSADQLKPSREILSRFGNMSSPTVLFILNELLQERLPRPCVALAFGPGLTIEAMLLE